MALPSMGTMPSCTTFSTPAMSSAEATWPLFVVSVELVCVGWLSAPVGVVAGLQPEASSIAATRARHKICFIVFIRFAPTYTQQAKRIPLGLLHKI